MLEGCVYDRNNRWLNVSIISNVTNTLAIISLSYYLHPPVGLRNIAMSLFLCLYVCQCARISQELHVQTLRNFPCMLSVVLARSASDDSAISHELPVFWMTSWFTHSRPDKGKERYLYSAFKYARILTKRSGMDHTVLPANNTMPAFPS